MRSYNFHQTNRQWPNGRLHGITRSESSIRFPTLTEGRPLRHPDSPGRMQRRHRMSDHEESWRPSPWVAWRGAHQSSVFFFSNVFALDASTVLIAQPLSSVALIERVA